MSGQLVAILAQIAAAQARIAGMQAANEHWAQLGQQPEFDQQHFNAEASGLEHLAAVARDVT